MKRSIAMLQRHDVLDLSPAELADLLAEIGQKPFRAQQIISWIYEKGVADFNRMTNLPQELRESLGRLLRYGGGQVEKVTMSKDGATAKYLFRMSDGAGVESVSMREGKRHSACLSTQVGCALDCEFCATGSMGFERNLSCGEILLQALEMGRSEGRITSVVFMGMGEPLLNVPNVLKAIEALNDEKRFALGARRITVSTCGIVPGILELARSRVPVRLALSLNSPFQEQRCELMPVAKKYPLDAVLAACEEYANTTGHRVTIEYVLLGKVNTSRAAARELSRMAASLGGRVNLIEYNPSADSPFSSPETSETLQFREWLEEKGVNVTIRYRRGRAIAAGCGQLALKHASQ